MLAYIEKGKAEGARLVVPFAEQRLEALDLSGVQGVEPAEGNVADVSAHVLVVVT